MSASVWRAGMVLAALLLAGCVEVAPQQVEQTIVIQRSGEVSMRYGGSFHDLSLLLEETSSADREVDEDVKARKAAELRDIDQKTLALLKSFPDAVKVSRTAPHQYQASWQASGKLLGEAKLPELFEGDRQLGGKVPVLAYLERDRRLKSVFTLESAYLGNADEARQMKELLTDQKNPRAKALAGLLNGFQGKLVVEIDDALLVESNASQKQSLGNGRTRHSWQWRIDNLQQPLKFAFVYDPLEALSLKLMKAPEGSSCKALIGQDCKCGPFLMAQTNGLAMASAAYEIEAGASRVQGCSDAQGKTQSVTMEKTGVCRLRSLGSEVSNKQCKPQQGTGGTGATK